VILWNLYSHGGSLKMFEKVQDGMPLAQVVEIMGEPSLSQQADHGTTTLIYGRSYKSCNLRIELSPSNTVISKQHAHDPAAPPEK
jgi:hypothetical protein